MPPRTRRSAAVAAAALVADMQVDSDVEKEEEQVDVEGEDELEVADGEEDEEDEDEEEEADAEDSQSEEERPQVATPTQPRLKITLKLPANNASSAGTATPDELEYAAFKRTPRRRAKTKVIQDVDIESEDPQTPSELDEGQTTSEVPSVTPSASTKPMTTRQAVLASVVDPTHVSLNEGSRSKKQPLNETELALRREETARKRKNLSEKKLEDEKAETINRLLKKQSKPRNKRVDDRSPLPSVSGSRTPKVKSNLNGEDVDDAEGEDDDRDAMDVVETPKEFKPLMYRWVSSLRSIPVEGAEDTVGMGITFSVPEVLFTPPTSETTPSEKPRPGAGPGVCAINGCGKPRKYRLSKDWTIGACDSAHLRLLSA